MDGDGSGRLIGSEIHGFHTLQDLDVKAMLEEAKGRWLRPNEIHAVPANPQYFTINAKPVQTDLHNQSTPILVHIKFELNPETLYLTVNIIDRLMIRCM
ncbi:hypothetical protein AALP_AA6G295300 [Arabis alpina]|uniref:Cyclin N-terminal domain-containing protein n=1 Tax=Arabis alpina TaxID=50452 RepID=A0A087GSK0_ARAAL|nr:hypothetical protein AALP_AA6G295300 [Arabis alpina]